MEPHISHHYINDRVMRLVVAGLVKLGYTASYEFPGFVQITMPDGTVFATGTANDTWDVERRNAAGSAEHGGSFDTGVPVLPASHVTDEYLNNHAALIVSELAKGLEVAYPVLTVGYLLDVISRTCSVMQTQKDDNGDLFAEPNAALYDELKAIERLARVSIETSHAGCAKDRAILEIDEHDAHCTCNDCMAQYIALGERVHAEVDGTLDDNERRLTHPEDYES